jgi:L-cysteine desulfidase
MTKKKGKDSTMDKAERDQLVGLLKQEVVPALGCTEPIAVALAVARAREALGDAPESVAVYVSPNILKNGMGVGIPGTGMVGLHIAAALGALYGESGFKLQLLEGLPQEVVAAAKTFADAGGVTIDVKDGIDRLFVQAVCRRGTDAACALIRGSHSNIALVTRNGKVLEGSEEAVRPQEDADPEVKPVPALSLARIYEFATTAPLDEIRFILEGGAMNKRISEDGLSGCYGLKVGKSIYRRNEGILKGDLVTHAIAVTTAASDARMAGTPLPVMSNSGSGNQGITVMLPVVATAEKLDSSYDDLARALVISNLLSIHIKSQMGRLSALCGVSVASAAASCGVVYLLGGTYEQMTYAIKNVIGNLTGMICDGAKVGCSLKVSSGVFACMNAALFAMGNTCIQDTDGIINNDVETTMTNMAELGAKGMAETDKMILRQMLTKKA